jgi:hypothetical protein
VVFIWRISGNWNRRGCHAVLFWTVLRGDAMKTKEELFRIAQEELNAEKERELVDKYKEYLKARSTFWHRIFPFKITIERR